MLPVPRAARPLLAVVVVQFGRVSRPGLARRTVGLPASQPGPARRRFHERARDPEAVATCSFAKPPSLLHTPRPLPCGVFMAVCGCRQMQSQVPRFFHGYITLKKKKKVVLTGLPSAAVVGQISQRKGWISRRQSLLCLLLCQKCRWVWWQQTLQCGGRVLD